MEFGPVPLADALGAILAHSHAVPGGRVRKGRVLTAEDLVRLSAAGLTKLVVARPGPDDVDENAAAARLAAALVPDPTAAGLRLTAASTGRVNAVATGPGILRLDPARINAANAVDPAITVATLPPDARLAEGTLAATVKIIAYAVDAAALDRAASVARGAMARAAPSLHNASLILTEMQAGTEQGVDAIDMRLGRLGVRLDAVSSVEHAEGPLAAALSAATSDLVLVLTASATSDARDVGPAALVAAGGRLDVFGMPVDPGNLLFLGAIAGRPVVGLPGCARSPAMNGADWVIERVICGHPPRPADIAAMGVGGLLKEIPARGHPRGD